MIFLSFNLQMISIIIFCSSFRKVCKYQLKIIIRKCSTFHIYSIPLVAFEINTAIAYSINSSMINGGDSKREKIQYNMLIPIRNTCSDSAVIASVLCLLSFYKLVLDVDHDASLRVCS